MPITFQKWHLITKLPCTSAILRTLISERFRFKLLSLHSLHLLIHRNYPEAKTLMQIYCMGVRNLLNLCHDWGPHIRGEGRKEAMTIKNIFEKALQNPVERFFLIQQGDWEPGRFVFVG